MFHYTNFDLKYISRLPCVNTNYNNYKNIVDGGFLIVTKINFQRKKEIWILKFKKINQNVWSVFSIKIYRKYISVLILHFTRFCNRIHILYLRIFMHNIRNIVWYNRFDWTFTHSVSELIFQRIFLQDYSVSHTQRRRPRPIETDKPTLGGVQWEKRPLGTSVVHRSHTHSYPSTRVHALPLHI